MEIEIGDDYKVPSSSLSEAISFQKSVLEYTGWLCLVCELTVG